MKLKTIILLSILSLIILSAFAAAEIEVNLIDMGSNPSAKEKVVYIQAPSQNGEFDMFYQSQVLKVCACSQFEDVIKIKNDQGNNNIYRLSTNLDYVQLSNTLFELAGGESKEVKVIINAPCKSFDKTLKIYVESTSGSKATFEKDLIVGKCQNLNVNLSSKKDEINPCETNDYTINVKNVGNFVENYSISSNQDVYMNYSDSSFILKSGEEKAVNAKFAPACSVYGNIPVVFDVVANKNDLSSTLTHVLTINKKYGFSVDTADQINVCEEEVQPVEIYVKNLVNTPNSYKFELVGAPAFVKLRQNNISLDSKEEKIVLLDLNLEEGANLGDYEFKVKAESEYGDSSVETNVKLSINDCYKPSISFINEPLDVCSDSQVLTLKVKNDGLYEEDIALRVFPGDVASIRTSSVTLAPGQEVNVSVDFVPLDEDKKYNLLAEAELSNGINESDNFDAIVSSQKTCHKVIVKPLSTGIRYDKENNVTLIIQNVGRKGGEYNLYTYPNFFMYLNQSSVYLEPGQSKQVTIISNHSSENRLGDYLLNVGVSMDDYVYEYPVIVDLQDKPIYEKAYIYFKDHPCQFVSVLILIAALILLLYAIFCEKKGRVWKRKFLIWVVILVIIAAASLWLVYYFKGPPAFSPTVDYSELNSTYYVWPQDKTFAIQIESFVLDPDSDNFTLALLNDNEYVSMGVDEKQIVFTPQDNWAGMTTIRVIATDSKGASTISPEIHLVVVESGEYSFARTFERLCPYENWILFLVCLVIIGWIFYQKVRIYPGMYK